VRRLFVTLVVALAGLAVVTLAPAKEGARARLTTPLTLGALPATTIHVEWKVEFPGNNGGRPFNAIGVFTRLLSRTGAPSTIGFASARGHPDGRYTADVSVPAGGIGGVRIGLRGTTDVYFPLDNDPFLSPGGVRCDVAALRRILDAFIRAYNRGDLRRLDGLFSRERFVWYSSASPGTRLLPIAASRETLLPYLRRRHVRGDRLRVLTYRFNGYEHARALGHFELTGRRKADDYADGDWFDFGAKGALDCSKPPVAFAVLSLGGRLR
jgi:hypothetical protein